jgi:ornithine cyclodeaminase/alanine dehydrogenase-like protein (mu-crystallin family)
MLVLTRNDIEQLYTMKECIQDVEEAFRFAAEGRTTTPVRTSVPHAKRGAVTLYMPSYIEAVEYTSVKVVSIFPDNQEKGLPSLQGVTLLTEAVSGRHVALLDATFLTVFRTGASSGVATKWLARADARSLAVLGCGAQALGQIQAVMAVRPIERLYLYNRTRGRAEQLAGQIAGLFPEWRGTVEIVDDPDAAVEAADIVVCSTKATQPLFDGNRLRPGTHVNAIGAYQPHMQEFDVTTLKRSSKVVVDTREGALHEAGDLIMPIQRGEWSIDRLHAELGEILAGRKPGRERDDEITLYKSVGIAYLDTMVARSVYEKAKRLGAGTEVRF